MHFLHGESFELVTHARHPQWSLPTSSSCPTEQLLGILTPEHSSDIMVLSLNTLFHRCKSTVHYLEILATDRGRAFIIVTVSQDAMIAAGVGVFSENCPLHCSLSFSGWNWGEKER